MDKINELIALYCPSGVDFRPLYDLTIWDKKFNGIVNSWQERTIKFKHVSAATLKSLNLRKGNVKLLSTGNYSGWTNEEFAGQNVNNDEVISIPSGGSANLKYYKGKFVDSGNILAIAKDESVNLKFVYYVLLTKNSLINSFFRGSGVKHPNMLEVLQIIIPYPPIQIQEEIVNMLDKFTSLETELEAELEARSEQYGYYRDKLLGFQDAVVEWKTLGEVGTFIRGNGLQKKDFTDTGVGCIHYGQIYTFYGSHATKTKSFVSKELAKKLKKASKNDLIIAGVSENVEDICKAVVWLGEDDICISGDAFIFKHTQNPKYIGYLLQTNRFLQFKKRYAQGAKVTRLKSGSLPKFTIPIPSLAEQNRIVTILDKFDTLVNDVSIGLPAEIKARRQQYEHYRDKLLTFN